MKDAIQTSRHVKKNFSIIFYSFLLDQDQRGKWEKDRKRLEWMEDVEELCTILNYLVFIMVLIQGTTKEWFLP